MAATVVVVAVSSSISGVLVHTDPVSRDRADFIISAVASAGRIEQLWARSIDEYRFELCCIPFFLYDVALGDIVETNGAYEMTRVIQPSGRFVFRLWFGSSSYAQQVIVDELVAMGALVERSSANMLAVDAASPADAHRIADALLAHEAAGRLVYETGRSA